MGREMKKEKAKIYNLLDLDPKKDKPTYTNGDFNWWLIEVSKSKRYCGYYVQQIDCEHNKHYVLVDNKGKGIVLDTNSLEALGEHLAVLDKANQNGWI